MGSLAEGFCLRGPAGDDSARRSWSRLARRFVPYIQPISLLQMVVAVGFQSAPGSMTICSKKAAYSIRPSARGKGLAKSMLRQGIASGPK